MESAIVQDTGTMQRVLQLVPPGQWLYAILDAARDPAIIETLCTLRPEFESLYRGRAEQTLWEVAPYLVRIEPDSEFCRWLFDEGWGKAWGVFALAAADLTQLHRHFRRFLMVRGPKNEKLYFRYYDPRVLRDYLPTCNRQEMATLFGPVSSYLVEAKDPSLVLRFTPGPTQVLCDSLGPDDRPPSTMGEPNETALSGGGSDLAPSVPGETMLSSPTATISTAATRPKARIQQVILQVNKGLETTRRTWIRPGQAITVGRTDEADFVVSDDAYLSGAHFELSCDFQSCRLRAISRRSGTYLNGQQVTQEIVKDRDEISAGRTNFIVLIETDSSSYSGEKFASTKQIAESTAKETRVIASIEVMAGPYDGLTADLPAGKPLVIGRLAEQGLSLGNDSSISRRHCQIEFLSSHCRLTDLESRFGTYVQAEKVTLADLRDGDTFKIGSTEFKVHMSAKPVPVKTLRIRTEQMERLAEPKRADFKERLKRHLNEVLPAKGIKIAPDNLTKQIEDAIARSKHYRVNRECDVAQYVEIVIVHLDGFNEKPHPREVRNILYDHRLSPDEKLAKLRKWAESATGKHP